MTLRIRAIAGIGRFMLVAILLASRASKGSFALEDLVLVATGIVLTVVMQCKLIVWVLDRAMGANADLGRSNVLLESQVSKADVASVHGHGLLPRYRTGGRSVDDDRACCESDN